MQSALAAARMRSRPVIPVAAALTGALMIFAVVYKFESGDKKIVLAIGAVAGALAVLRWTQAAFVVWVVIVGSIFHERLLRLSFGTVRSDLGELIAFSILALTVVRWAMGDERLRRPKLAVPFLVFAAASVGGAAYSSYLGFPRSIWLGPFKELLLYLLPLAVVALFRTNDDLDALERWILRICVAGSAISLISAFTGIGSTNEEQGVVTLGVTSLANRLRPAILHLLMLGILLLIARCVHSGTTPRRIAGLTLFATSIALSFTRSTWVPMLIAIAVFIVARPGRRVPLRGLRGGITVTVVAAIAFFAASAGVLGADMKAVSARVQSVGNSQVFQENSYQDRANEDTIALNALQGHELLGIGLGRPYGASVIEHDPITGRTVREPRQFIHNSYLGIWMWTGLLGLVAFALLALGVIRFGIRTHRLQGYTAVRAFAGACTIVALMFEMSFQTDLFRPAFVATLTCAVAFLVSGDGRERAQ